MPKGLLLTVADGNEIPQLSYDPPNGGTGSPADEAERDAVRDNVCGVSRKVFFITTALAAALVIATTLAGGLGGGLSSHNASSASAITTTTTTTSAARVTVLTVTSSSSSVRQTSGSIVSSAYSAASAIPSTDCPSSNGSVYESTRFSSGQNGAVPAGAVNGLRFQKLCGVNFADPGGNLVQGTVMSFETCIDLCASYNFWNNVTLCDDLTYATATGGCWAKDGSQTSSSADGADSALLIL